MKKIILLMLLLISVISIQAQSNFHDIHEKSSIDKYINVSQGITTHDSITGRSFAWSVEYGMGFNKLQLATSINGDYYGGLTIAIRPYYTFFETGKTSGFGYVGGGFSINNPKPFESIFLEYGVGSCYQLHDRLGLWNWVSFSNYSTIPKETVPYLNLGISYRINN